MFIKFNQFTYINIAMAETIQHAARIDPRHLHEDGAEKIFRVCIRGHEYTIFETMPAYAEILNYLGIADKPAIKRPGNAKGSYGKKDKNEAN